MIVGAVGGTSASSPEMAGIMALIDRRNFGRQGQANCVLYPLAAQHPSVFHDVAVGSNNVPCDTGTPNCTVSALNDNTKGDLTLGHYYATAGYDEATRLRQRGRQSVSQILGFAEFHVNEYYAVPESNNLHAWHACSYERRGLRQWGYTIG